jgi:hypothetical protein
MNPDPTDTARPAVAVESPALPNDQAAENHEKNYASEAFVSALNGIPVIGSWFVWITRTWGSQGLLLFLGGATSATLVILGLLILGKLPSALVPDAYQKRPQGDAPTASLPVLASPEPSALTSPIPASTPLSGLAQGSANGETRVWVNTDSGVYHCPGSKSYGTTKQGEYMAQRDAQIRRYRPSREKVCQ